MRVGGQPAANADFIDAVYGSFPLMIALIAITTFVLLARAFRSLLLPVKAILLNILSVAAAWGVLVLVWQHGYGSEAIWGIQATGSIPSWMPLMVFAFLFGLSMDYEVFILSRMREEYDRTGSTETAVVHGIGRTGRLVTSAALILFLSFASMASGPDTDVKMLATGLAAGILLDATVIRALIVPAVDRAHGPLELVAAVLARARPARRAVAAGGGPSSPGVIAYGVVSRPERTAATTSAGRRDALRERRARRVASMDLELRDKVAVVTGASKGIGLAVVRQLAEEGALVVAGARSTETLDGLDRVTAYAVDLVDPDGPGRLVAHAIDLHGRVDVLVNNVGGVHPRVDGFLSITDAEFEASMQLNFFAALRATRAAVADMLERREGTIVNVASVNAFFEPDGAVVDYGAAKAALLNVAKALSQELAPQGHPHQQRLARAGGDRPVARRRRRRRDDRPRDRRRSRRDPDAGHRPGHPDRPLQHPRGGRDPRGAARLAADGERHRLRLRHRRRSDQDDVSRSQRAVSDLRVSRERPCRQFRQ